MADRFAHQEAFEAAADYYTSRVLEDDGYSDRSRERGEVEALREHLASGQPLSQEQHRLAETVLGRYLGFLARGGYSQTAVIDRDQVEAVHQAQAALSTWPRLDGLESTGRTPPAGSSTSSAVEL